LGKIIVRQTNNNRMLNRIRGKDLDNMLINFSGDWSPFIISIILSYANILLNENLGTSSQSGHKYDLVQKNFVLD